LQCANLARHCDEPMERAAFAETAPKTQAAR